MKRLLIVFLAIVACSLFAGDRKYEVHLDYNSPTDSVTHYNIFIVELTDTTQTPFTESGEPDSIRQYQIGSFNHDSLYALNPDTAKIEFLNPVNDKYLQAAATAVNKYSESKTAVSNFHNKSKDRTPAPNFAGVGIRPKK